MTAMGSLFDGIGGFPLAAVHNGITPAWASEIEAFPIAPQGTVVPSLQGQTPSRKLPFPSYPISLLSVLEAS